MNATTQLKERVRSRSVTNSIHPPSSLQVRKWNRVTGMKSPLTLDCGLTITSCQDHLWTLPKRCHLHPDVRGQASLPLSAWLHRTSLWSQHGWPASQKLQLSERWHLLEKFLWLQLLLLPLAFRGVILRTSESDPTKQDKQPKMLQESNKTPTTLLNYSVSTSQLHLLQVCATTLALICVNLTG